MENKEKLLKKSQDKLLEDVLKEAKAKNSSSVKLLNEILDKKDSKEKINEHELINDAELHNNEEYTTYQDDFDDSLLEESPFDLVQLPSKGLIYKNVKSKIAVSYLTASDEDMITSPNLYLDGRVIDLLLKRKIIDKKINPDLLCKGDRDAIMVFLRSTSYGTKFPVSVKDPITGNNFDTEVDLSEIKINDFNLVPDENGLFTYKLPKTEHEIKFKFMTYLDEKNYSKILEKSHPKVKKHILNEAELSLENMVNSDDKMDATIKLNLNKAINYIKDYNDTIKDDNNSTIKGVTYILEKCIVSIEGNTDRNFIKKYVSNMPAFDSLSFRKYVNKNTPSLNYEVTVNRPENLGGGSFKTFLELDSTFFINNS